MKIVLATRNRKKLEELRRIAQVPGFEILSLDACPDCPEVVEDGDTFEHNALKKAREVAQHCGHWALADDSGLVVDALDGAPGVFSARYAGAGAGDADNLALLMTRMASHPWSEQRSARFVCVLALADAAGRSCLFHGRVEGRLALSPRGSNGFGYDPAFIPASQLALDLPEAQCRTFAQLSPQDKDAESHRGRAMAAFAAALALQGVGLLDAAGDRSRSPQVGRCGV
ncbi:MAG: RdgB/HAM1 family non-canonical purine NTP pyrophosphatase [Magnetococcus sp. WYHC-3]